MPCCRFIAAAADVIFAIHAIDDCFRHALLRFAIFFDAYAAIAAFATPFLRRRFRYAAADC